MAKARNRFAGRYRRRARTDQQRRLRRRRPSPTSSVTTTRDFALVSRLLDGASKLHRLADLLEAIQEREEAALTNVSDCHLGADALTV